MTTIGYQVSSLKPLLTTPEEVLTAFRRLHEIGYRDLQIQWISPEVPDEFVAEALQETRLTCISTQDKYITIQANFDRFVRQNELWNSKYMCVSGIPKEYMSKDGLKQYAEKLRNMADVYKEKEVLLAFHPVHTDYSDIEGRSAVDRLMDHLPDDIQLTICLYHTVKAALDPIKYIKDYSGRADMVHFKNSILLPNGEEALMPIGQGSIQWSEIFEACRNADVKWGFVEQESWQKDAFLCAQESYDYVTSHGIV